MTHYLQVDDEGYLISEGVRWTDEDLGRDVLKSFKMDDKGLTWANVRGNTALIEAFDEPLVVQAVDVHGAELNLTCVYGFKTKALASSLNVDEWDRFHGRTESGVCFILSRKAQVQLFDAVDEFDDDSITLTGQKVEIQPWLAPNPEASTAQMWSHIYQTEEPRWDLAGPHPAFVSVLPQIKLPRSRIAVLGCGRGHDAAFFAEAGHIVTAFDFSAEAIAAAKEKYSHIKNLTFVQADAFKVQDKFRGQFDLVVEHTFYCAVDPKRRNELMKVWRQLLIPNGFVLGIFFVMDKRAGPPFGGSEWELRRRFEKDFRFLYWTRWHHSPPSREHRELVIYAQKR